MIVDASVVLGSQGPPALGSLAAALPDIVQVLIQARQRLLSCLPPNDSPHKN